jgi:DNA polymerase-3 subunit delta'
VFGKMMFARIFSKAILCLNETSKPCEICASCIKFNGKNNPDYFEIDPDGNSIKIEQIRDMQKTILEKPITSIRKVYIINNSELMTKEAQNSLLKTLEEPPSYICIILISSNDNMFLNTIKSRCTKVTFNKLTDEELKKVIERIVSEQGKNVSENVIKIANGSVTKGLRLEEKEDIFIKVKNISEFIKRYKWQGN